MIELILLIAGVLLISAFCSCAEAALVSITPPEADALVARKAAGASALATLRTNMNRTIIGIVVLNNVVNIAGSVLVGQVAAVQFGSATLAVVTAALTFAVIVFSEILPKTIGIHYAPRISGPIAVVLYPVVTLLLPLSMMLEYFTNLFKHGERKIGTEEQIRSLVSMGRRAGYIERDEGHLIHRAFILNDRTAAAVMTPLKDIIALQSTSTVREAANAVLHHAFSRYPVVGPSVNDVHGLVRSQDILEALSDNQDDRRITDIMREVLIVDHRLPCDDLLVLFRDRHIHLAVVQEDGHTLGVVTLEDVLEELVGEIEDETDVDEM